MSDTMLHGVLNMPISLWKGTELDQHQRHMRYVQASEELRAKDEIIAKFEEVLPSGNQTVNTMAGFRGGFLVIQRRPPTEQEIWNAGVKSGINRTEASRRFMDTYEETWTYDQPSSPGPYWFTWDGSHEKPRLVQAMWDEKYNIVIYAVTEAGLPATSLGNYTSKNGDRGIWLPILGPKAPNPDRHPRNVNPPSTETGA